MRKLFLFLCAALMSVGMWANPIIVTWNSYDLPSSGSSFTKDGVTVTCDIDDSDLYGPGTFTTDLGNFTQIVVSAYDACYIEATGGWSGNTDQMTWTGNAASVSWDGSIYGFSGDVTFVFTIEPAASPTPDPEPAGDEITVTWNDPSGYGFEFTQDGVTLTCGEIVYKDFYGTGTFTTDLGNFTKIEVYAEYGCLFSGDGWSGDDNHKTWTGNAASVSFSNDIYAPTSIVFTIEPEPAPEPEPEPATIQATQFNVPANWEINADPITASDLPGFTAATTEQAMALANDLLAANPNLFATLIYGLGNNVLYIIINGPYSAPEADSNPYYTKGSAWEDQYEYYNTVFYTSGGDEPEPTPQPAEDVNITPNVDPQHANVYYSTFFDSSVKYELPAGVEAYVADLSGANLLLTKIAEAGEVIPANVAVILKSTVTPFTLTVSDADAVTFTATNDLQGSDTQIATPANCYVLAGNDGVGFYHYTASMLNPHKAYVIYSGSNQAPKRMPFIFDQATGVENVQGDNVQSTKVIENGQLIIIRNGVRYNAAGQNVK